MKKDKFELWIEAHRLRYLFFAFILGFVLAFFQFLILESSNIVRMTFGIGLLYSSIFILIDLTHHEGKFKW